MALNDKLWEEEKLSRKRLIRRSVFLVSVLTILLIGLSFWLTQPLFTKSEKRNDLTEAGPSRLQNHVTRLSKDFYPRNHQNVQNLNLAADYIRNQFEETGGEVSEQIFDVNGSTYRNVILRLGNENQERIVIGAHYDAAYDTPGADDNASGVAGLIELAHLLAKEQHNLTIEFVAYSLEEPPYFGSMNMGSFVHAKSLSENKANVKMMICLEMIGYYSDEPNTQNFPLFLGRLLYPTTGNFTAIVGDFSGFSAVRRLKYSMSSIADNVYSLNAPVFVGGVDLSDHRNYWHFGYDAVMVTDTAFYRNRAYHTLGDTADSLDYVRMAKLIDALNVAVLAASQ